MFLSATELVLACFKSNSSCIVMPWSAAGSLGKYTSAVPVSTSNEIIKKTKKNVYNVYICLVYFCVNVH